MNAKKDDNSQTVAGQVDRQLGADGEQIGLGITVSRRGGFCVAVYRCHCGREQTAQHDRFHGGISPEMARQIGWERAGDSWECPFCSDNEDKLRAVFAQEPPPPLN